MISYSLAKKLKDAGFPQPETPDVGREYFDEDEGIHVFSDEEWDATNIPVETSKKNRREKKRLLNEYDNGYLIPTLSELIEACIEKIPHFNLNLRNGVWTADFNDDFKHTGSTSEEAVANLWLALRKKL